MTWPGAHAGEPAGVAPGADLERAILDPDVEPLDRPGVALGADDGGAADGDDDVVRAFEADRLEFADLEVAAALLAARPVLPALRILAALRVGRAGGDGESGRDDKKLAHDRLPKLYYIANTDVGRAWQTKKGGPSPDRPVRDSCQQLSLFSPVQASIFTFWWRTAALLRMSSSFSSAAFSSISSIAPSSRARRVEAASKICRSE